MSSIASKVMRDRQSRNGTEFSSEVVKVTPEMAALWLERNGGNRSVSAARVEFYAKQMRAGEWKLTHQGIAFDRSGDLVDGQHRLWAVIESGVAVKMLVSHGLSRDDMIAIDGGRPRSAKDAFQLLGDDCSTRSIATARLMLAAYVHTRRPSGRFDVAYMVGNERLRRFHSAVQEAIQFSSLRAGSDKGLRHSCVSAAIACAWFTENRDLLSDFRDQFESGVIKVEADIAATRLRNFMLSSKKTRGGREARADVFVRACTAIRAYVNRNPISKLYAAEDAIFHIPDIAGVDVEDKEELPHGR